VTIGDVTFAGFGKGKSLPGCSPELQAELQQLMGRFVNIHGDPVGTLSIGLWQGDATCAPLTPEQVQNVFKAAQLLMLAYHSMNRYFCNSQSYVNSSLFTPVIQNFQPGSKFTAVVTRRRDGSQSDLGHEREKIKTQAPRAIRSCRHAARPADALLNAISRVYGETKEHHRKIVNSLFYFSGANTDELESFLSTEAVLLAWSIDRLLGPCWNRNQYADGVKNALDGYLTVEANQSPRPIGGEARKGEQENWLIIRQWAYEHYLLRNAVTHGHDVRSKQWRWDMFEHCAFAAWLYPLLVKLVLAAHDEYELTENDEARLHAADHIVSAQDWRENWQNVFRETGFDRRLNDGLDRHLGGTGTTTP